METTLGTPNLGTCSSSGLKGAIARQFGNPSGFWGGVVGRIMALKNAAMHEFAVECLDVQPTDRVLEIGFGPGRQLAEIAGRAPAGLVAGIDLSPVMVAQAARRLSRVPGAQDADLRAGSVESLPWPDAHFTKVCATNNFQFWPDQLACLEEAARVLAPGGTLLLCLRTKESGKPGQLAPGFTVEEIDAAAELMARAGLREVRRRARALGRRGAVCVLGEK